jgi:3-methyladenine DNA glycosylase AlkD
MDFMTAAELLQQTRSRLQVAVDPVYQEGATRFFRGTEGQEANVQGVRAADLKKIEQFVYREVKYWPADQRNHFCNELWKSGVMEEGALVCHLYRRFEKSCAVPEFDLFEKWIDRYVRNWAHCDGVSTFLIAACLDNERSLIARLPPWTTSKNRWKRRSAAVSLVWEGKRGRHTDEIFYIASRLIEDPDDMVQKGVGWLLKETYPKMPKEVVDFLQPWKAKTTRLLLRYAAEKMSARDRALVLG